MIQIEEDAREKVKSLLKELFQFDNQDLDFGIYRIMKFKRKEIEKFVEQDLIIAAEKQFREYSQVGQDDLRTEVESLRREIIRDFGAETIDEQGLVRKNEDAPKIKQYLSRMKALEEAKVTQSQINDVFNHIFEFFSRYYDEGDFIPKRRYGGRSKYYVPYKGEETAFYWATRDMYYIKTGEFFKKYSFRAGRYLVTLVLSEASIEAGTIKGEKKYFILSSDNPVILDDKTGSVEIRFNYRELSEEELSKFGKGDVQKVLVDNAIEEIMSILENIPIEKTLKSQVDDDKSLIEKHLDAYVSRNTKDFFIHKDLKGFLESELEFYLKNEVWSLEELETINEASVKLIAAKAKAIHNISSKIIEFLDQIEAFQKKLFEKKKFVLRTDYCITLDHINEKHYSKITGNPSQLEEWKRLYSFDLDEQIRKFGEKITSHGKNKQEIVLEILRENPTLAIDTKFYEADFRNQILSEIEELDEKITGILIKSDNYHALNLLVEKYRKRVDVTYIDPPYNTALSEINYKNNFKHSSWLSLIASRLEVNQYLLKCDGLIAVTIDNVELHRLRELMGQLFGEDNILGLISIKNNPSGRSTVKGVSVANEFAIICGATELANVGMLPRTEEQIAQYPEHDSEGYYQWRSFIRCGGQNDFRSARPRLFYPLVVDGGKIRIPDMQWDKKQKNWILTENTEGKEILYPISNSTEYTWRLGVESLSEAINSVRTRISRGGGRIVEIKFRLDESGVLPKTFWDNELYNSTSYGTSLLKNIFGEGQLFSFPKSVFAVADTLRVCNLDSDGIVIDYFAGSGTTAHAVLNLNKDDRGRRKFILVESGEYFDTVLKSRILKIIYSNTWKDGIPSKDEGNKRQIIKYQSLEQYEDTLNNIVFREPDRSVQETLDSFKDYFLRYMLDYETRESSTRLAIDKFQTPFDYRIKVISGNEEKEITVDLVETFNYLLGLSIEHLQTFNDGERMYQVVFGEKENKRVVVIWRNRQNLNLENDKTFIQEKILSGDTYDLVFVNGDSYVKNAQPIEPEFKKLMGA